MGASRYCRHGHRCAEGAYTSTQIREQLKPLVLAPVLPVIAALTATTPTAAPSPPAPTTAQQQVQLPLSRRQPKTPPPPPRPLPLFLVYCCNANGLGRTNRTAKVCTKRAIRWGISQNRNKNERKNYADKKLRKQRTARLNENITPTKKQENNAPPG